MTDIGPQPEIPPKRTLKKDAAYVYTGYFLRYLSPLILVSYYSRVLGPEGYGQVLAALSLMAIVGMVVGYGFLFSGVRELASGRSERHRAEVLLLLQWWLRDVWLHTLAAGEGGYLSVNRLAAQGSVEDLDLFAGQRLQPRLGILPVERMRAVRSALIDTGGNLGPFAAFLVLRGLPTLSLRMERHSASALDLAAWLEGQDNVERVYYPGLPFDAGHDIARRQLDVFGGMLAFELRGGREAGRFFLLNPLDEPLAALDRELRERMQEEIRKPIQKGSPRPEGPNSGLSHARQAG